MIARGWLVAVGLMALATGVGCVDCRHRCYQESLCVPAPYPPPMRHQVYLFMMNGYDLLECGRLLGVRDEMCRAGYPKVYYAQRPDQKWFAREMRWIARNEPHARIILLGYGGAADPIRLLAGEAARDGLPIDAVVFLDPVGASGDLATTLPFPSLVIRSHNWRGGTNLLGTGDLTIPHTGHYSLPTHPATIRFLTDLMTGSASQVPPPGPCQLPMLPLTDKRDSTPRGIDPATLTGPLDEWDFLKPGLPFPPGQNLAPGCEGMLIP